MAVTIAGSGTVTGVDPDSFETGLRHIVTKDFSAVSSVSVDDCFTSEFENYRVLVTAVGSVDSDLLMRLRASGTDDTSSNYAYRYIRGYSGTTLNTVVTTSASAMRVGSALTGRSLDIFDLASPFVAGPTMGTGLDTGSVTAPTAFISTFGHNVSSAYDGFTVYPSTGTMTGTFRVYGYMNGVAS